MTDCIHPRLKVKIESMSCDEHICTAYTECMDCDNTGLFIHDGGVLGENELALEYLWHSDYCRSMQSPDPATQYCRCEVGD